MYTMRSVIVRTSHFVPVLLNHAPEIKIYQNLCVKSRIKMKLSSATCLWNIILKYSLVNWEVPILISFNWCGIGSTGGDI